ncbi:MAG: hypothetical protein KJ066_19605 [Acidobacteria bacterium]|nr:hypothetical protein [Acidobacteriota bacterium]
MRRLIVAGWLALASAGGVSAQTPRPVTVLWDLDASHEGVTTWEIDADGVTVACTDVAVVGEARQCGAALLPGTYEAFRLRGVAASCGDPVVAPCPGGWSAPIAVTVPSADAPGTFIIRAARAPPPEEPSMLLLYVNFEAGPPGGSTYTLGATEHSAGSDALELQFTFGGAINATGATVGSYGVQTSGFNCGVRLPASSGDVWPRDAGRVGWWVTFDGSNDVALFTSVDSSVHVEVRSNGNLRLFWGGSFLLATGDYSSFIPTDRTPVFIELKWDRTNNLRALRFSTDGAAGTWRENTDSWTQPAHATYVRWAGEYGAAYFDNLMISDDPDEDLYALRNLTDYADYGGGGGGQTYNEALSLAAAADLAPSGSLVMSATQALSASAALAPSAALVIGATVALAADAAITTPSQAALAGTLTLPAAAALTPTSTAALVATLALQGAGGLGVTSQATLGAALALPAEAGLGVTSQATLGASLALPAAAGLGVVSQATVDAALALVASGTLTPAGAVVAQAVLALGLEAGYVTSAQIVGAPETHHETLALAAAAGLELQATGLLGAVQAFAAAAGLTQDGATVIGRALALAVEADLTTAAQGVLRPTLALPVDATLTSQAQAQLVALLTLSAAAVLAQAAQLQGVITYDVLKVAAETLRAAAVTHETLRAARALDETLH